MLSPLVQIQTSVPQGEPQVDSLVTVRLFNDKVSGARIARIAHGTYFVKLSGLNVPAGYYIGMPLPLNREAIIDW